MLRHQTQTAGDNDRVVAAELAALSRGHTRVLRRAQQLVEQWPGQDTRRIGAFRRLAMAVALLELSGWARGAWRGVAAAWLATGVTVAAKRF